MDLLGRSEKIEEERDGEEGGEEEEAFGLGLEMRFRVCGGWGEEVHARVQLGAVGRDVGGGRRPRLEVRHFFLSLRCRRGDDEAGFYVMVALFRFWWRVVLEWVCAELMIMNELIDEDGLGKKKRVEVGYPP